MMTGFLLAYACITAPVFAWAFWRAMRKRAAEPAKMSKETMSDLEKMVTEAFGKQGIPVKVHEIPKTPTEAIIVCTQEILMAMVEGGRVTVAWLTELRNKADVNKRDMDAMLQVTQSIAKMLLEMKDEDARRLPGSPETVETFVHTLEYARDKYADTPAQKKVVETIISSIKTNHGTRK